MRNDDEDDEDFLAEALPPLIPPGQYDAIITAIRNVERFKRALVEFSFRIVTLGPYLNVMLKGYCVAPPLQRKQRKKARIPAGSKLASWMRVVATFTGGSPTKVPRGAFKTLWFTVQVETVKENHRQKPFHGHDQHSTVTDILDIVGKLSELPPDSVPPSHQEDED